MNVQRVPKRLVSMVLIRRIRSVVGFAAVAAWWTYCALVMSWAGHRPLQPDAEHPFAYENHGTIYVSADDLRVSHLWFGGTIALLVVALLIHAFGKWLYPDLDPPKPGIHSAGGAAQSFPLRTALFFIVFVAIVVAMGLIQHRSR